jgi:hypothetical protein
MKKSQYCHGVVANRFNNVEASYLEPLKMYKKVLPGIKDDCVKQEYHYWKSTYEGRTISFYAVMQQVHAIPYQQVKINTEK